MMAPERESWLVSSNISGILLSSLLSPTSSGGWSKTRGKVRETRQLRQMRNTFLSLKVQPETCSFSLSHTEKHCLGPPSQLLTEPPLFGGDPLKRRLKPAAIPLWIWSLSRVTRLSRPGPGLLAQTHGNNKYPFTSPWMLQQGLSLNDSLTEVMSEPRGIQRWRPTHKWKEKKKISAACCVAASFSHLLCANAKIILNHKAPLVKILLRMSNLKRTSTRHRSLTRRRYICPSTIQLAAPARCDETRRE